MSSKLENSKAIVLSSSDHIFSVYVHAAVYVCESERSSICMHSQALICCLVTLEKIAITCGVALTETRCSLLPLVSEILFLLL